MAVRLRVYTKKLCNGTQNDCFLNMEIIFPGAQFLTPEFKMKLHLKYVYCM